MKKAIIDKHTHTVFGGHAYSTVNEKQDEANDVLFTSYRLVFSAAFFKTAS